MHLFNAPGYPNQSAAISVPDIGDGITLAYTAADLLRPSGHQHWCMTDVNGADIAAGYYDGCVKDTAGVEYNVAWNQLEPTKGTYDFSLVMAALNRCAQLGKMMAVRVMRQSWNDANSPPKHPPVPADIAATPLVFSPLLKIYMGTTWMGWGADLTNTNTKARFKAMLIALASAVGSHPAFSGWMLDESNTTMNGVNPASATQINAYVAALKDIYTTAMQAFGVARTYPMVNLLNSASAQTVLDLHQWCVAQGMPVAISDTYTPDMMGPYLMPPYRVLPIDRFTVVTVDYMTIRNPDPQLFSRCQMAAQISYALGADVTAWNTMGGATGPQWAAIRSVIQSS